MLKLTVQERQNLKEFTENNYAQASFFWHALMKNKDVKVNGKKVGENVMLEKGDEVCYYLTEKQAQKVAYSTVYEDENIFIIDKESGVNSEAVFAALSRENECYFIHRLDRNTKGLLVFARTKEMEEVLLSAFREKRVEKVYEALCVGTFLKPNAVLTAYLQKDAKRAEVCIFEQPKKDAEKIITEYKVLKEDEIDGVVFSTVSVILHTGKTHQIRAHLAHIGHAIVGDTKYGDKEINQKFNTTRQILVAKSLRLDLDGKYSYLGKKTFISRHFAVLN